MTMQSLIAMLRFKFHHLFAYSLFVSALYIQPAQAMGVSFGLTEPTADQHVVDVISSIAAANTTEPNNQQVTSKPLALPATGQQPPISRDRAAKALPDNVVPSTRILPPPPAGSVPTSRVFAPAKSPTSEPTRKSKVSSVGLHFQAPPSTPLVAAKSPTPDSKASFLPNWIYEGGSNSLVARVIGSAEGTRTASGKPTRAYYGHTDPGNGVWNIGTFSYQHGAKSPEEADKKQLKRLKRQGKAIAQQAQKSDLTMSLGEILNGLDLANQAPLAALDQGGYVDRLAQARQQGMSNSDAIIWARTYAYIDPKTQRWNAPGLGNTLSSIKMDQLRRHDAVARAFNHYQAELPAELQRTAPLSLDTVDIAKYDGSQPPLEAATVANLDINNAKEPIPNEIIPVDFEVVFKAPPSVTNSIEQEIAHTVVVAPQTSSLTTKTTTGHTQTQPHDDNPHAVDSLRG